MSDRQLDVPYKIHLPGATTPSQIALRVRAAASRFKRETRVGYGGDDGRRWAISLMRAMGFSWADIAAQFDCKEHTAACQHKAYIHWTDTQRRDFNTIRAIAETGVFDRSAIDRMFSAKREALAYARSRASTQGVYYIHRHCRATMRRAPWLVSPYPHAEGYRALYLSMPNRDLMAMSAPI